MLYPDPEMLYVYKEKPPEEDVKYWKLTVVPITITFTIPKHK